MQQAFAAERTRGKHVLINLRRGRAVRVDTALSAKEPVERRGRLRAGQRRGDARLQDGIARQHAAAGHVHAGQVQRVRGHPDQRAQRSGRQHGVAVEGDHVQRASSRARVRAQIHKRGIGCRCRCGHRRRLGQHTQQLLQLAALALPAHPALLRVRPLAFAVQQQKAPPLHPRSMQRIASLQRVQSRHRLGHQRRIPVYLGGRGVGKISQQGKLRLGLVIGQKVQFQLAHQIGQGGRVAQQRRNHHQHPVLRRYAIGQRQARQALRLHGLADQPVQHRNHRLTGRPQGQKSHQPQHLHGRSGQSVLRHKPSRQTDAAERQHTQINRCDEGLQARAPRPQPLWQSERLQQGHHTRPVQPVPRRLAGLLQQHLAAASRVRCRRLDQL